MSFQAVCGLRSGKQDGFDVRENCESTWANGQEYFLFILQHLGPSCKISILFLQQILSITYSFFPLHCEYRLPVALSTPHDDRGGQWAVQSVTSEIHDQR